MGVSGSGVYPTGGGVGLIGMWKAFAELEELGWVPGETSEDDCRAIGGVRTGNASVLKQHEKVSEDVGTRRHSLRGCGVPKPYGDYIYAGDIEAVRWGSAGV